MRSDERDEALGLVDEIQQSRSGVLLADAGPSRIPHILLGYQARWHADMSPVRLFEKGRRIGLSWGAWAAEAALEAAASKSAGGQDQFYMGYNQGMAAEFIGDCAFFAKAYQQAISEIYVGLESVIIDNEKQDIVAYKIKFASGHKIEALSSMPHNWRGRQGHARIDEAAFHNKLDEVIKGALAYRLWGGRVSIASTHNGEDNAFNLLVREIDAGKLEWSKHRTSFEQALAEGFYKRVCLIRGLEWSQEAEDKYRADAYSDYPVAEDADEELGCIPKRGSGAFFTRMLIENCQKPGIPTIRFSKPAEFLLDPDRLKVAAEWIEDNLRPLLDRIDPTKRTVLGQDFARDGHLSVIWPLQQVSPTQWETLFLLEMRRIPFDVQQLLLFAVIDGLPLFHHGKLDAGGNGQSHAEAAVQRYGAQRIEAVKLSGGWYDVEFPKYHQAYQDQSIIVPESEDVIADHRSVVLVNGSPRMSKATIKGSDGQARHGDSAVAGLLAWTATRCEAEPAAGESVENDPRAYSPKSARGRTRVSMFTRR